MDIIIAGAGKVGLTLLRQLAAEGHNLTLIDLNHDVLGTAVERFDAIGVEGNCASKDALLRAGIMESELLIATTGADEVNLLCCMTAHGLNPRVHTIARIRDPEYGEQVLTMPRVFPLSLAVNPERRAAQEIERLLRFPGFLQRDFFAKGRAQIVELRVDGSSKLRNVSLMDMYSVIRCRVLVCAVLRAGAAVVPKGNFTLREGDRIFVTAPTPTLATLLKHLGIVTRRVHKVILCGGGRVSYYLAGLLEKDGISVRLLERRRERCAELAEMLPKTEVVCADCSSQAVLDAQGIGDCDALVTLTGIDETNMIVSLYGESKGVPQIITKLSRSENSSIADSLALGSVIYPNELCCNSIIRYARAMENQIGAAVSVYAIADGQAEAVEFLVDETTEHCGVPLKSIKLKENVLIGSITHGAQTAVPNGNTVFTKGDTVVVVTSRRGMLNKINDIFA